MPKQDTAWFDSQYNNRARVPEHVQILEKWTQASRLSRDSMSRRIDVAYGKEPAEKLDVFPTTAANAPVLVFIHGGCWRTLDKRDHSFVAPAFVNAGAVSEGRHRRHCFADDAGPGVDVAECGALRW